MLTPRQAQLLRLLDDTLTATGVCPSYDEMLAPLGYSPTAKSSIHRLVCGLIERGYLRRGAGWARSLEVVQLPADSAAARSRAAIERLLDLVAKNPCAPVIRNAAAKARRIMGENRA